MTAVRGYDVRTFADAASLDRTAADLIVDRSRSAAAERGTFSVALSGGMTPRGLYGLLALSPYRENIEWNTVHVFWADERSVPPDHEDSNYRLAHDLLLSKVPLPQDHIHRIRGESDPASAAAAYDDELRSFFGSAGATFDLVLLGIGADGHTASLFPGDAALAETRRLAVPVPATGNRLARVTLTLSAINRARAVLFLATGESKAKVIHDILDDGNPQGYPAGLVRPERGRVLWYLDNGASRFLRTPA